MLPYGSTVGILGGGQLGRMLAIAAAELGYHAHIFSPEENCPAAQVARRHTLAAYDDEAALEQFAKSCDVVTFEFENIPVSTVEKLAPLCAVFPSATVLRTCQHRLREKEFVSSLGIKTAPFMAVLGEDDCEAAAQALGVPCVFKTSELGYDGKGQVKYEGNAPAREVWQQLGGVESIAEGFMRFKMEISVLIARNAAGQVACYVPVENIHKNHILHQTLAPARITEDLAQAAENIATRIAEALGLVGILAVEMFVLADGTLAVNELAPRPHNSGHWTLDACVTSQFEQTVRAVCGLPLGSPERFCDAVMTNLIGDEIEQWKDEVSGKHTKLHLYGKTEVRPGRKMGHVTMLKHHADHGA